MKVVLLPGLSKPAKSILFVLLYPDLKIHMRSGRLSQDISRFALVPPFGIFIWRLQNISRQFMHEANFNHRCIHIYVYI